MVGEHLAALIDLPESPPSLAESVALCTRLARTHYENFTLVSWLVPRWMRPHVNVLYAFCRTVDDVGDEAPGDRNALLDRFESELHAAYGGTPHHPVLVALRRMIDEFDLPKELFLKLIEANRIDQGKDRYATFSELLYYCDRSANPVGRLFLMLFGYHDEELFVLSDATCTALQLVNFWQDVKRDYEMGRIYLPQDEMIRYKVIEEDLAANRASEAVKALMQFQVERAREYFCAGFPLIDRVRGHLKVDIALFSRGGLAILEKIEAQGYDTLAHRPTLGKREKLILFLSTLAFKGTHLVEGKVMDRKIKEAYEACSTITRQEAKNFYFAFITLPRAKRRAIYAIYAFCREADDIADGDTDLAEKIDAFTRLRKRLAAIVEGKPQTLTDLALSDAIVRFSVDPDHLVQVINGVEMDLTVLRYETFTNLHLYCHLVASAVGLSVLPILAHRRGWKLTREVENLGEALGLGLQLANIVRDVAEDIERNRIYIPLEDLKRFAVTEEMLRTGETKEEVRALLAFEIERARGYIREGEKLIDHLPRHARSCLMLLAAIYSRILDRIETKGYDVFNARVSLSAREKLILTFRTWVRAFLR